MTDHVLGARDTAVSGKQGYGSCSHRVYDPVGKLGVKQLEYECYVRESGGG